MNPAKPYTATSVSDFKLLEVISDAFRQNEKIPVRYTCDGININPSLNLKHIPNEAVSLAIIVDDPDAPNGSFCHWVTWNIPVTHQIKEKEDRGITGMNDFGYHRYSGPCPPSGTHRYFFKLYALDCSFSIPVSCDKNNLEAAMAGHILAFGELEGTYQRSVRK